uniref:HAT C-terminal dimerisation domain-containing protein n=1 Tax=Solanum lycopersicum TaxID=4081 RepID=A0A3Q7JAS0_SOLLC
MAAALPLAAAVVAYSDFKPSNCDRRSAARPVSHKGEHLVESISNCLLDWKLDNVFTVTVDNASSNDVAVLELSKKLDMWGTNFMEGKHLHITEKFEKAFESFDLYDDWANVRNVTKFLEKFYELTLKVSGSRITWGINGNVVNTKVEANLRDLFAIYVSKYGKDSKSQPSSSDSCDSSACGISQNVSKNSLRTKLHMKKQKKDLESLGVKSELDKYLIEDQEPESGNFDILSWWKVNSPRFSVLSQLAQDLLSIPMSSVASECAFSTGDRILDPFRSSLTPK